MLNLAREQSSNVAETSSIHLNDTQISQATKGSAEKDYKEIESLINKVVREDKANTSISSSSKIDKSNSMISNLEIWNTTHSPDDSKNFYENFQNIDDEKKKRGKIDSTKKNMNKKNHLEINTGFQAVTHLWKEDKDNIQSQLIYPSKKLDGIKRKKDGDEDYNDEIDESVEPVKKEHLGQIHNYEPKNNNLILLSLQNAPFKMQTCPDEIYDSSYFPRYLSNYSITPTGMSLVPTTNYSFTPREETKQSIFPIIHETFASPESNPQGGIAQSSPRNDGVQVNKSSTRHSTESNDSGPELQSINNVTGNTNINSGKFYTPKHFTSSKNYNLNQVQRELDFHGNSACTVNSKFQPAISAKPSNLNVLLNSVTPTVSIHPQPSMNSMKSLSFCGNNLNNIRLPTTVKYDFNMKNKNSSTPMQVPPDSVTFGNKREEHMDYKISLENIIIGKDKRTTLMLRNIPNKYTLQNLIDEISPSFWGKYDYINLPIDYERKLNLGYAFLNFVDPLHIILFYETYHQKKWSKYKSDKKIDLNYADKQGKKDITCKDENTYFAIEDKRFHFQKLSPKIELPYKYLDFFKKIYINSVCIVEDKTGLYGEKCFYVKSLVNPDHDTRDWC